MIKEKWSDTVALPGADEGGGIDIEYLDIAVVAAREQSVVVVERCTRHHRLVIPRERCQL